MVLVQSDASDPKKPSPVIGSNVILITYKKIQF